MLFSQLGAAERFIDAANHLMLNVTLSNGQDAKLLAPGTGPIVYIQKADRAKIANIIITADQRRASQPDSMPPTDLDQLLAPFLSQLEPYIKSYGSSSFPG